MHVTESDLQKFILDSGLISRKDIALAIAEAEKRGVSLGEALITLGYISEDDLRRLQAHILGIPFISLKGQKIDPAVLMLIPEPIARTNNVVAYKKTPEALEVAMLDTQDLVAINFIKKKVGLKILPRLTDVHSLKDVLLQYQRSLKEEFGDIIRIASRDVAEGGVDEDETALKKLAEDVPVIKVVDTLLRHAIIQGASDIHVEPMDEKLLVRYRIDGLLHDAMELPKHIATAIVARLKVLSHLKLDEKRLPQDGRFKIEADGERVSFRVSVLPTYYGEKVVMRLLKEGAGGFTLESLGFHGDALEKVHKAMRQKTGMILVTGPTGSGKTTTIYTILDLLNKPEVNISTIEDPIEYQIPRVNQTQVRPDIDFTFAQGLRALLRQDPDVIMVGEIRDSETANLAVNASLTGHVVLSTLHTNSAAASIGRLIDLGAEPFLLTSTLRLIVGQRLVRRLCPLREAYTLSPEEITSLQKYADVERVMNALKTGGHVPQSATIRDIQFYKPKKTDECPEEYAGRLSIYEVLYVSRDIRDMITKGADTDTILEQAKKEGMLTMLEDGIYKAATGVTTIEEVLRVVSE